MTILRTPLYNLHLALGGKMVAFAGYDMPVQYPIGIIKEHLHTRTKAGLFDISHMGQIVVEGGADICAQMEKIMPGDFMDMADGAVRYSFILNDRGGVVDDLMLWRDPHNKNSVRLIVNASRKHDDLAWIEKQLLNLGARMIEGQALLALQGPCAGAVLSKLCAAPEKLSFMQADYFSIPTIGTCFISRSGYTGEDGFEISVPSEFAETLAKKLLDNPDVAPIGLGARDSLRLESGLCLYGHDLTEDITPIEANLIWAIGKRRRSAGGFMGAERILHQIQTPPTHKRVGIMPTGRVIAREHTQIHDLQGKVIGTITSGGFGATVEHGIAMGYVQRDYTTIGTEIHLSIRGQMQGAKITTLPFTPHRYFKKG